MNPVIDRLKLIFLGVFVVINIGLLVWEFGWEIPRQNCEKAHKWWDGAQRVCAQPVLISDITGRLIDNPKAKAEALEAIGKPVPPALQRAAEAAPPPAPAKPRQP
jgi:hypothetical protein